jgi:hypothetical protein
MYYPMDEYKFSHFEKSRRHGKKYDAIIYNNEKEVRIPFGAIGYDQYEDKALRLYSDFDHYDKTRRDAYRRRHKKHLRNRYFSPSYFSWKYLW